ncbi:MAG TPA: hypothetical protein DDX92_05900 [Flavobacteriales bacterium]|jgi:hypothetical protein|nr:hypothetical protein [Flavobacteriales bacterium]
MSVQWVVRKSMGAVFLISVLFSSGCKKDNLSVDYTIHNLPTNSKVRGIYKHNGKYLLVGGDRSYSGFILQAAYGEWEIADVISDTLPHNVYDVRFEGGRYTFGAEEGETYFTSIDLEKITKNWISEENWIKDPNKKPMRRWLQTNTVLGSFIASGGDWDRGVIYQSLDSGLTWVPHEVDHDLRTVAYDGNGTVWTAGYGLLMKKSTGEESWTTVRLENVFTTDILFLSSSDAVMSTYDGQFLRSSDGGFTWRKEHGGRGVSGVGSINSLLRVNENLIIAFGNNGNYCESLDNGQSWKCDPLDHGKDMTKGIVDDNGNVLIGMEGGKLLEIIY